MQSRSKPSRMLKIENRCSVIHKRACILQAKGKALTLDFKHDTLSMRERHTSALTKSGDFKEIQ